MNPKEITLLFYDYGSYIEVAKKFTESFACVYYFNPNVHDGFQDKRDVTIGEGILDVIKVKEWASVIDMIDMVFFSDCYEADLQSYFRNCGKLVFGSGQSSILELDRGYSKQVLEEVGLPIGPYQIVRGVNELESTLREKENVYIKSNHRGNHETTKWKNYTLSKGEIRRMRKDMSIFGDDELYILEDQLDCVAEIGSDSFCIEGQYPSTIVAGIEVKDCAYLCKFMPYSELPKQVKMVMDRLSPKFEELGYRGWFSNEIIIAEDMKGYMLDFTCRMPQPPTTLLINNITNFAECAVNVASGIVPRLECKYRYGCQFILHSDMAQNDDTPLIVPKEYQSYVSLKNLYIDEEGTWYYARRGVKMREIGSVIGLGDTLKQAIDMARMIAKSIQAEDAHIDDSSIDKGLESLKNLSNHGIRFI